MVITVLGPLASVAELLEDSHRATKEGEHNGENTTRVRDGELVSCNSDGNSAPGSHRWSRESTSLSLGIENARVGFGEEDEQSRGQETSHDCTDGLGQPLLIGSGAKQEADTEVPDQVRGLVGTDVGNSTTEQVETLSIGGNPALCLGRATEDDL